MPDPTLLVVGYNATEPRVVKRARAFAANGREVVTATFRRSRLSGQSSEEWVNIDLGRTRDRAYGRRVWALARGLWRLLRHGRTVRRADVVYAFNMDLAFLALVATKLLGHSPVILYETGDVQPVMVGRGVQGRLIRAVERWVLRRVDLLVVTSEAFVREYYEKFQGYHDPFFLLENKLYPAPPAATASARQSPAPPWRIGLFGALRCRASWRLIDEIAGALPDRVRFELRGYPTLIDRDDFEAVLARRDNVTFHGRYQVPDDLREMYSEVDLVWGFELVQPEHNSRWLLPTRLYEGGYHGVPFLVPAGFEVARVVEELGIGWSFTPPYAPALIRFLEELDPAEYQEARRAFQDVPVERWSGAQDHARLLSQLQNGS